MFSQKPDSSFKRRYEQKREGLHAVHLKRMGKAWLRKMTAEERREIARKASLARWAKERRKTEE
jgi:hypothetical protein